MYAIDRRNIRLKFLRDTEFTFMDSAQRFDWSKITIKKDTIVDIDYCTYGEFIPTYEYDKFYLITFEPSQYKDDVIIEVLRESEYDTNDVEELRKELVFLEVNAEDVKEIK